MQTKQMWKLVALGLGAEFKKTRSGSGRNGQTPDKRYKAGSGTIIVRALNEAAAARVIALLESLRPAAPSKGMHRARLVMAAGQRGADTRRK